MIPTLEWRRSHRNWWNADDDAIRYASREYSVMLNTHQDVWRKCEKVKAGVIDKNIFSDRMIFTVIIPEYDVVAGIHMTDDIPTEEDVHYIEVDFLRYLGKIYIVAIRGDET